MFSSETSRSNFPALGKSLAIGITVVLAILLLSMGGKIVENVDAKEIMVVQDAIDGEYHWYTTSGIKPQWFGQVTKYPRQTTYEFKTQVRFNDGGHGTMEGSVQWEMPLDEKALTVLHQQFGSPETIQVKLIEKVVNKSVYMTGPLMSSRESYAEKRNYLISYVEDQIANGVYRTVQHEVKVADQLTGQEKTAVVVEIVLENGQPARQEESVLGHYGIRTSNFAISGLPYDETVEKQIQQQQQIAMQVQTAIAEARQAEQKKITVEQQGAAAAAQAKWEQEVIKAKEVTAAEQRLEVAQLDQQAAEATKQKEILLGQGEAERRRLVLNADGALTQKLDTYKSVNQMYAEAIAKYPGQWVPTVVMGENSGGSTNGAQQLINMLMVKTAKDLALDMSVPKGATKSDGN